MAKLITESPRITDEVLFDILTPDIDGCFLDNPHRILNVTIYFIVRDFTRYFGEHIPERYGSPSLLAEYQQAKNDLCTSDPGDYDEYYQRFLEIEAQLEANKISPDLTRFFFASADPVLVLGGGSDPAWDSISPDNSVLQHINEDEDGNPVFGHFRLLWNPVGMREGDYFIQWTWQPLPASSVLTQYNLFHLLGNTQITTSLPIHFTQEDKYETLLDRYLPEMFRLRLLDEDISPEVLSGFNKAIAKGFTNIEDMANQVIDLIDANSTPESLLKPLAGLFNHKLRSADPTMWRKQIKRAIPLYKKKGTISGLREALSNAGFFLQRLVKLWQVKSNYTYQELFYANADNIFDLGKDVMIPINPDHLELWYREKDEEEWLDLSSDYDDYIEFNNENQLIWKTTAPLALEEGDSIRLLYQFLDIPVEHEATDLYIRGLPLADERDEREQDCPAKDWNTRLIEEDDAMFDTVISDRHPFHENLIYGWIRTEFPYAENIYNMDEYNGSTRESKNPCHIDCYFVDPCSYCQSSKFNLDLEVENLGDDRISEAYEIIEEFIPFHASIHRMNFQGIFQEFVQSPTEHIETLVTFSGSETMLTSPQLNFNRSMSQVLQLAREDLADSELAASGTGEGSNLNILLFSPTTELGTHLAIDDNILEVLSPHANAGNYEVDELMSNHYGVVLGVSEPFDPTPFTFRFSNRFYTGVVDIFQDNIYRFSDLNHDFTLYPINPSWEVSIDGVGDYSILQVLPNGNLILDDDGTLPEADLNDLSYTLNDAESNPIINSNSGQLRFSYRGRVETSVDVKDFIKNTTDYYLYLGAVIGTQYPINSFVSGEDQQFYISGYDAGDDIGTTITVVRRNVHNAVGQFVYSGLKLTTVANYENDLDIENGINGIAEPTLGNLKENYLIKIDSDYYMINEIDGSEIILGGPHHDWEVGGTGGISFEIYRYTYESQSIPDQYRIPGHDFEYIHRDTGEVIESHQEMFTPMLASSLKNGLNGEDMMGQQENISYKIEYREKDEQS